MFVPLVTKQQFPNCPRSHLWRKMKCEVVKGTKESASSTILECISNSAVLMRCENQTVPTKICQRNNKSYRGNFSYYKMHQQISLTFQNSGSYIYHLFSHSKTINFAHTGSWYGGSCSTRGRKHICVRQTGRKTKGKRLLVRPRRKWGNFKNSKKHDIGIWIWLN